MHVSAKLIDHFISCVFQPLGVKFLVNLFQPHHVAMYTPAD